MLGLKQRTNNSTDYEAPDPRYPIHHATRKGGVSATQLLILNHMFNFDFHDGRYDRAGCANRRKIKQEVMDMLFSVEQTLAYPQMGWAYVFRTKRKGCHMFRVKIFHKGQWDEVHVFRSIAPSWRGWEVLFEHLKAETLPASM